ncbi:uncharacterized protein BKA78DRAFT_355616 [Phyllosticta capitalensis]|uniref:uncharacterized protein n=1 Tax=Phyllosticta capitalensis TaxID=121624 RepID=UPI00312FCB58
MISAILLIIITIFIPPIGVLMIAGCGADFCINVLLTLLGYLPGHIHAFYIEYVYYKRREDARKGLYDPHPASGVYSDRVQRGGLSVQAQPPPPMPAQQGTYDAQAPHAPHQGGQQGYGTV